MERAAWAPQGIDLSVPSVSRMYDFYLGGSHNFEVDREAARQAMEAWPGLPKLAQANRAFVRRAVRYAISEGVTQLLDVGSGIPTFGAVHETAVALDSGCRVLYADNDQVAVAHSRTVLQETPTADIVSADLRTPQDILESAEAERLLDLRQPVALFLTSVLHYVEDKDEPEKAVRALAEALAPGSLLAITHASTQPGAKQGCSALRAVYGTSNAPLTVRSRSAIEELFGDLELVEPGVVALPEWRPEDPLEQEESAAFGGFAGVGRKAGTPG